MGKGYLEDQLMHISLDKIYQGGKHTAQISTHQAKLIIKENFSDQTILSISSLKTDKLNLYGSSDSGRNNKRANI